MAKPTGSLVPLASALPVRFRRSYPSSIRLRELIATLLAVAGLTGCLTYTMSVEVSPDDLTHTQLERADIVRVSRAVEATVERFGFQLDPRAGEIFRDSEMSRE